MSNWVIVIFTAPIFVFNYKEFLNKKYKLFYILGEDCSVAVADHSLKYKYKFLAYFLLTIISFIFLIMSVLCHITQTLMKDNAGHDHYVFKIFGLI